MQPRPVELSSEAVTAEDAKASSLTIHIPPNFHPNRLKKMLHEQTNNNATLRAILFRGTVSTECAAILYCKTAEKEPKKLFSIKIQDNMFLTSQDQYVKYVALYNPDHGPDKKMVTRGAIARLKGGIKAITKMANNPNLKDESKTNFQLPYAQCYDMCVRKIEAANSRLWFWKKKNHITLVMGAHKPLENLVPEHSNTAANLPRPEQSTDAAAQQALTLQEAYQQQLGILQRIQKNQADNPDNSSLPDFEKLLQSQNSTRLPIDSLVTQAEQLAAQHQNNQQIQELSSNLRSCQASMRTYFLHLFPLERTTRRQHLGNAYLQYENLLNCYATRLNSCWPRSMPTKHKLLAIEKLQTILDMPIEVFKQTSPEAAMRTIEDQATEAQPKFLAATRSALFTSLPLDNQSRTIKDILSQHRDNWLTYRLGYGRRLFCEFFFNKKLWAEAKISAKKSAGEKLWDQLNALIHSAAAITP